MTPEQAEWHAALKQTQRKLINLRKRRANLAPIQYEIMRRHHLVWCRIHRGWVKRVGVA
jgi:hypothetical protein